MRKLSWDDYFERTIYVKVQFDLAREAISTFRETPDVLKRFLEKELNSLRQLLREHSAKTGKGLAKHWAFSEEEETRYFEVLASNTQEQLTKFENSLKQSELILRVTIFEIFMKNIHRQVLRLKPTLLNVNKQIPLGHILSLGYKKTIEEQIDKAVDTLDRMSVGAKAKYFKERMGIDWFEGKAVPLLEHVINVRNSILHENPDRIIDKVDMGLTVLMCTAIPFVSIAQGAVLYPNGFKMVKGIDKAKIKKLMKIENKTNK